MASPCLLLLFNLCYIFYETSTLNTPENAETATITTGPLHVPLVIYSDATH